MIFSENAMKSWRLRKTITTLTVLAVLFTGCTGMRISGVVLDSETGDPAGNCYVTVAAETVLTDFAGQYRTKVRRRKVDQMEVICADYEPQTLTIDKSKSRRQVVDVQMVPIKRQRARVNREPQAALTRP